MQAAKRRYKSSNSPLEAVPGPELVFAIVGAIGTDVDEVATVLAEQLSAVEYTAHTIKVSSLLYKLSVHKTLESESFKSDFDRKKKHMEAGSSLREKVDRGDILALMSIAEIRRIRQQISGDANIPEPGSRVAYILRSLKHPDEIRTLRDVYGRAFYVISAYSPRSARLAKITEQISRSSQEPNDTHFRSQAETLVEIDEREGKTLGQNVRESFPLGDVFVDARSRPGVVKSLSRFVELLFSHPFQTPTRDESAMFHAHAAALRSSDLGRQVGAAITSPLGDIIAVGCNDVPRFGGGLYWPEDPDDARDFRVGTDSNSVFKRDLVSQLISNLRDKKMLSKETTKRKQDDVVTALLADKAFKETIAASVIEFGRSVHAEMAAITDAARRGISLAGTTLFSTTFPCHLCARHIIAAGIRKVVYVEPYPKSRAERLYGDSICVDPAESIEGRVVFTPFVGIAPAVHIEMFKMRGERKTNSGKAVSWTPRDATPRLRRIVLSYISVEQKIVGFLLPDTLASANIHLVR